MSMWIYNQLSEQRARNENANRATANRQLEERFQDMQRRTQRGFDEAQGFLDEQLRRSDQDRQSMLSDRDRALSLLESQYNVGDTGPLSDTRDQLSRSFRDSPFAKTIRQAIQEKLNNPVIDQTDISQFSARANDFAAAAVNDALEEGDIAAAQRGVVGGGMNAQRAADARMQAGATATQNLRDFELGAQQLNDQSQQAAIDSGVQLEIGLNQAEAQRLGLLSDFETRIMGQQFMAIQSAAELLANTVYQTPDLSGFADLAIQSQQALNDLQAQFDNMMMMRQQIAQAGANGANAQALQAQLMNQSQQSSRQINDLIAQLQRMG